MKQVIAIIGLGILAAAFSMFITNSEPEINTSMEEEKKFSVSSSAFLDRGFIPSQYTCDGTRTMNPPLMISNPPEGTRSFVLIMDDPDIPQEVKESRGIEVFDHWVMYGIPADTTIINEGESVGVSGLNGAGNEGYTGPCPPPEYEPTEHRYFFTLYALSGSLQFAQAPTKAEVEAAMHTMILGEATLIGRYDRK